MKKIGLLFGENSTFAHELIGTLNLKGPENLVAESVNLANISHATPSGYDLIFNLHPGNPTLYQSFLQAEALKGCQILNNPFLFSGFDRFVASVAAENVLLNVVPTHLLPSYELPPGNSHRSFPNLTYPWGWEKLFDEVGFPAIMKPVQGGEAHHIHRVDSKEEFFDAQRSSGNQPMILQKFVKTEEIYMCFYMGNSYQEVMVLPFDPAHGAFLSEDKNPHPILSDNLKMHTRAFADEFGCDFCALVFAIYEEEPYFIDIHNPTDFLDEKSLGPARFRNLIKAVSDMIAEKVEGEEGLSWGLHIPLAEQKEAEDSATTSEALPEKAKEQLLAVESEGKEEESQEFFVIDTSTEALGNEETPAPEELVELSSASHSDGMEEKGVTLQESLETEGIPQIPPMITYATSTPEQEENNWATFKKEEFLSDIENDLPQEESQVLPESSEEEPRSTEMDNPIASHLPPTGIHVSDSKQKVIQRIASRIHQVNFHRIGRAMESESDDLKKIFGIGPFIEEKLQSIQIHTFRQIANFTEEDERILNEILEFFPGRIERDEWVKQAKELLDNS